jgi:hypothetical protein
MLGGPWVYISSIIMADLSRTVDVGRAARGTPYRSR